VVIILILNTVAEFISLQLDVMLYQLSYL
jgi:hypothetical protein